MREINVSIRKVFNGFVINRWFEDELEMEFISEYPWDVADKVRNMIEEEEAKAVQE